MSPRIRKMQKLLTHQNLFQKCAWINITTFPILPSPIERERKVYGLKVRKQNNDETKEPNETKGDKRQNRSN